jgi:hypothetical protein
VRGPHSYISPEEVAEFTLLQNQFSAEFARSNGGNFITVTKSGANDFHGSAYTFWRNRYLNALDTIQKNAGVTRNPADGDNFMPRNDFFRGGFNIGGPVFFPRFGEGWSQVNNEGTISVLGRNIPVGDVSFASPNFFKQNHAVIHLDYNQSSTTLHHWRFSMTNGAEIDNSANLPIFFTSLPLKQPAVQNILHDTSLNLPPHACLNQNNFMHPTKMNSERSR